MGSPLDSSLAVAMHSFTIIAFALLLSASISSGGVVRRSIQSKPYKNAKDLLSMKGAGDAIKRSFQSAGSDLEALADELDREASSIADLAAYIKGSETEKMAEALAEAKNIQSLMNDQRTELSGLAKQTISKSERIIKKFREMAAGSRKVDRGMRSVLRDMRSLLRFSEGKLKTAKETISTLREITNKVLASLQVFKLKTAKETISTLREKINKVLASLQVLKKSMEKEVELIVLWKDAVEFAMQDVFAGDVKDKSEEDAQDLYEEIEGIIEDGDVESLYEYFNGLKDAAQSYLSHIGDKTLNPGDETTLRQTVPLMPPQAGSLVEDVAHFLNRKIDFVGHDNGLRRHIAALQIDFEELNNLDNEAWKHNDHVQKLLTSLTNAVTELRKVEDDVISLARTSRTDVTGLETHLKRFKRQVDGQLSTDDTYSGIMDLVGKLISDSSDIMKKEIEDISEAQSMLNTAAAEMHILQNLLKRHEEHVWDHQEKFNRIESNILSGFQYFRKVEELVFFESEEMRIFSRKYNVIRENWGPLADQDVLEEIIEYDEWEEEVMADIRRLKSNVNKFVTSAGHWSTHTLASSADTAHLVENVAHFLNQKIDFVGHDNGLRRHITALENDFKELNNLDNEAWQHNDHVQKLLTSLTNAVTELRKVEDDVISLARTSRTDVTGLETHLNRFKRQVDGQLSTDDTYSGIMDLVGKLISDSSDIMKKEIKDINEAESMLNTAQAEMTVLKNLLKHHEKHEDEIESAAETGIFSSLLTAGIVAFFDEDVAEELAVASL